MKSWRRGRGNKKKKEEKCIFLVVRVVLGLASFNVTQRDTWWGELYILFIIFALRYSIV